MKNKDNYTHEEVEQMGSAINLYRITYQNYQIDMSIPELNKKEKLAAKKELNNCVEECNKTLPKSLIDKLGIKKVE